MNPSSSTTFTDASRTFGATPATPIPLRGAAIVPATCVPCVLVVGAHAAGDVSGTPSFMQPTDFDASTLAARSGWLASMPESSTPTSTFLLPPEIALAWSALICLRFHWLASSGSGATAPAPPPFAAVAGVATASICSICSAAPRCAAAPPVAAAPSSARLRDAPAPATPGLRRTVAAKSALVDVAMTTPICGQLCNTSPPAARMDASVLFSEPCVRAEHDEVGFRPRPGRRRVSR